MVAYVPTFPTSRPVKGDMCHLLHSSFLAPFFLQIDQEQLVDVSADVVVVVVVVVVAVGVVFAVSISGYLCWRIATMKNQEPCLLKSRVTASKRTDDYTSPSSRSIKNVLPLGCLSVFLSVCLFVCRTPCNQDISKSSWLILMKFGTMVKNDKRKAKFDTQKNQSRVKVTGVKRDQKTKVLKL